MALMPNQYWTLETLAEHLNAAYRGDKHLPILGLNTPECASEQEMVFVLGKKHLAAALVSKAPVILHADTLDFDSDKARIQVPHVRRAVNQVLELFHPPKPIQAGVHPTAILGEGCEVASTASLGPYVVLGQGVSIGENTCVHPHVVLGDGVSIGANCIIYPHVTLYGGVSLGDEVIVHSGTRIGSDGYGFYFEQGQHHKIPQVGRVRIGNQVEIGANVTIDRGALGDTLIEEGTKIDNLVQIGHNVKVGKHGLLVSQVGISGSTELGEYVTLAGQVGVAGHLKIGSGVIAAGKSGITKDIPAGLKVAGFPAQDAKKELRVQAALRRLPELLKGWSKNR